MMRTPFSSRAILPGEWGMIRGFKPSEFQHPEYMGYEFIMWLDKLRFKCDFPFRITSSYRDESLNARVGGAVDSAHCDIPCNAVDIGETPRDNDPNWNHSRFSIVNNAIVLGCTRIGLYTNGSVHLDMTMDRRPEERIWRIVGNV